ncbi:MAG: hypothetical protein PHS56_09755, partial [Eubacteriales bacterium]|nr:hypothetical protein [Eubacteriales bacterium]
PVRAQIARYTMPVQREMAEIKVSALADKAGVYGALELARQKGATGDCPQWSFEPTKEQIIWTLKD